MRDPPTPKYLRPASRQNSRAGPGQLPQENLFLGPPAAVLSALEAVQTRRYWERRAAADGVLGEQQSSVVRFPGVEVEVGEEVEVVVADQLLRSPRRLCDTV